MYRLSNNIIPYTDKPKLCKKGGSKLVQSINWITIPEAAEILGVSAATVRRRIKDGSLKSEKMVGPNGTQYFIDPEELKVSMEMVNVVPVKHEFGEQELEQLITKVVSQAVSQAMSKPLEEININIVGMASSVEEALNKQNEALKKEIATLHESIKATAERQKARETTHYDLVDQRLQELATESKKGFWARLFNK